MKKISLVIILLIFVSCNIMAQSNVRAMWVWGSTSSIIEYPSTRTAFYNFCANPPGMNDPNAIEDYPRPITLLFTSAHGYVVVGDSVQRAKLHAFLKDAHSRNLKVEYLDGDKTWATTNISAGKTYLDYVIKFNAEAVDSTERFDGIQYDVEPYLNSGWSVPSQREDIWNGFIELLTYCQTKVDSLNDGTYFGVAIPRWYDSTTGWLNNRSGIYYFQQLMNLVDYVAIMDYVDTPDRIIKDAGYEVMYAGQIGKRVVIGVETQSVDPPSSTFFEEGWGNMEDDLYQVDQYFKDHPGYAGIAIHHYDYYKSFPKWGTGNKDITPPELIDSKFVSGNGNSYFQFHIVDICGTGVDENNTIQNSTVSNMSNGNSVVNGIWKDDSTNYISFYPDSSFSNNAKYLILLHAVDPAGNYSDIKDTIVVNTTPVGRERGIEAGEFTLDQNYPNPFNPATKISFTIDQRSATTLKIYDTLGQEIKTLVNNYLNPGTYQINFDSGSLPSGVYIYTLNSGVYSASRKMILLK